MYYIFYIKCILITQVFIIDNFGMERDEKPLSKVLEKPFNDSQEDIIKIYLQPNAPNVVRVLAGPGSGKSTTAC